MTNIPAKTNFVSFETHFYNNFGFLNFGKKIT